MKKTLTIFAVAAGAVSFSFADSPKGGCTAGSEKESRILEHVKGTPTEKEKPRDILVNHPDYVVFVPTQPRDAAKRDISKPGDTYNDHFQVIYNPSNRMLYAFWTQATYESDIDQHVAFAKSSDKGVTWTRPVILAGSHNKRNPALLASWQQPMLTKGGRLYCFWNQQKTGAFHSHYGDMYGIFSDDGGETWTPPQLVEWPSNAVPPENKGEPRNWCIWQRPLRLGPGGTFIAGVSHYGRVVDFINYLNIDDHPAVKDVKVAFYQTGGDILRAPDGFKSKSCEEASMVRLPDGRLFAILRSHTGHPIWTQSRDDGRTWSKTKVLVDSTGKSYLHPCSPCPMYDWKGCEAGSGKYFAFIHNHFDYGHKNGAWQPRGPLYLIAGEFDPKGEQPVRFGAPKLFAPRKIGNSFYTSYTVFDGKGILWFNDDKFYLCGRVIGPEWFE